VHNAVVENFTVAAVNETQFVITASSSGSFVMQSSVANRRAVTRKSLFCSANAVQQRHSIGFVSVDGPFEWGPAKTATRRVSRKHANNTTKNQ
jgi:hypothetical protein